jgi:chemotaxis protein MotB
LFKFIFVPVMGKRKHDEGGGVPEWMCTFGDMMSLLLCFFIMLFAISIIAEPRFQAVADTLSQDFTGHSGSAKTPKPQVKTTLTPADSAAKSRRIAALSGGQPTPGPVGEFTDVHMILLDGETVRGGVIRFEPGRDTLTEQAKREVRAVLPQLQGSPQKIMVRGHAAPSEGGGEYKHNFDLAFYRALGVEDYLVSLGLKREFFETVVDLTTVPRLNFLPAGTDPKLAGASVEIILLNQTLRSLKE